MTKLLPLAYGYLRDDLLHDSDADTSESRLRAAASFLGYELGTVFHESAPESGLLPPAFVDLVQECYRAAASAVITLPGHMSDLAVSRTVLQAVLDARAHAAVHEVAA